MKEILKTGKLKFSGTLHFSQLRQKQFFFYSIVSPQAKTVIVENGFLPLAKQSQTKPNNTKTHYLCVQILFDVLQEEHVNEAKVYKKLIKLPF